MYQGLLIAHSLLRWLVLTMLLVSLYRAYRGYRLKLGFSAVDNAIRHWTATTIHIQLAIGIWLYTESGVVKYFRDNIGSGNQDRDAWFFGIYHLVLMLLAVILVTIGSAIAKRKPLPKEKHKTILIWFGISLLVIFIAIPWPFSPFTNRPFIRL
jgi:hypothetical protein